MQTTPSTFLRPASLQVFSMCSTNLRGDVHGVDLALGADLLGEQAGEQAGAGPDVGHGHARLELAGGDDLLAQVKTSESVAKKLGLLLVMGGPCGELSGSCHARWLADRAGGPRPAGLERFWVRTR